MASSPTCATGWRAVIGLNLCPFAKSVYVKDQVRYVVSDATRDEDVLDELERELRLLETSDPEQIDTTLLIVPHALGDFLAYNDFLYFADRLLRSLKLEGTLQIASFHPHYQFEGTEPDDIENLRIARRIRSCICCVKTASRVPPKRSRRPRTSTSAIWKRCAGSATQAGSNGWLARAISEAAGAVSDASSDAARIRAR
jgi:hypothetical protein